jgi:hypothetical protein
MTGWDSTPVDNVVFHRSEVSGEGSRVWEGTAAWRVQDEQALVAESGNRVLSCASNGVQAAHCKTTARTWGGRDGDHGSGLCASLHPSP